MNAISKETLSRLPSYLRYLMELNKAGVENVSSTLIAERFKLNSVSVRKDIAIFSPDGGKPKTGFCVKELIKEISDFLGFNNTKDAILVGVGKLGSALLCYKGFDNYGLNIVASFDNKTDINLTDPQGRVVYHIRRLPEMVKDLGVRIGIITVPAEHAQEVCDIMVKAGIKAIWNFSPTNLIVPENIAVKNEDMAASLALLSQKLTDILNNE